jgi:hypothetical protein
MLRGFTRVAEGVVGKNFAPPRHEEKRDSEHLSIFFDDFS